VAKKLNIPVYVLSKAENGEKILSYDFIKKYLEVFNINIENYKKFKNFKKNLLI
jgi:transcriptional regulator with XRE-family HTH domain